MSKDKISIIIPCFNEEESIPIIYKEIKKVIKKINTNLEIIFIDDGSTDNTLNTIKKLSKKDRVVRYISFSKNFGKESAMYAGLNYSTGNYVTIMDCDMQDDPNKLIDMYNIITTEDYDCVGLYSKYHKDYNIFRKIGTKIWYKLFRIESLAGTRDYRLMNRKVVDAFLSLKESNRYTKGIFNYIGFKTKWLEYKTPNRVAGKSKYNLKKLTSYSIEAITSFSIKPLIIPIYLGLLLLLISIILFILLIFNYSKINLLIGLIVLFTSIELLFIGIIGLYVGKIYMESKNRPLYIINETEKDNIQ
ncbi:MAG: glycosyltransferase family 2 protein [Bacilli bacterium]|nr:glycosyltransferase family 2 protein [Bacilli bacterium]